MQFEVMASRLQKEALKLSETARRLSRIGGVIDSVRRDLVMSEDDALCYAGSRLGDQLEELHGLAQKTAALGKGLEKIALLYMGNDISIEDMTPENVWHVPVETDALGMLLMTPIYDGLASETRYRPELIDTESLIRMSGEDMSSVIQLKG